jgi:hypothetical protein
VAQASPSLTKMGRADSLSDMGASSCKTSSSDLLFFSTPWLSARRSRTTWVCARTHLQVTPLEQRDRRLLVTLRRPLWEYNSSRIGTFRTTRARDVRDRAGFGDGEVAWKWRDCSAASAAVVDEQRAESELVQISTLALSSLQAILEHASS